MKWRFSIIIKPTKMATFNKNVRYHRRLVWEGREQLPRAWRRRLSSTVTSFKTTSFLTSFCRRPVVAMLDSSVITISIIPSFFRSKSALKKKISIFSSSATFSSDCVRSNSAVTHEMVTTMNCRVGLCVAQIHFLQIYFVGRIICNGLLDWAFLFSLSRVCLGCLWIAAIWANKKIFCSLFYSHSLLPSPLLHFCLL